MVSLPETKLDDTSKVRFIALIGTNFVIIVWIFVQNSIKGLFNSIAVVCAASFIISMGISISEFIVRSIEIYPSYNYKKNDPSF